MAFIHHNELEIIRRQFQVFTQLYLIIRIKSLCPSGFFILGILIGFNKLLACKNSKQLLYG